MLFPPNVAVTRLVNSLKGASSRRLRQAFPDLVHHYWRAQRPLVRPLRRRVGRRPAAQHPEAVHRPAEPAALTWAEVNSAHPCTQLR
ncbi:transposase [Streptomyces sp. DSM 118148]|uniref:transposase n=1 Tax=Streptomyces sp. DSM 118148 TaxID=3448667 RepID=UPI00404013FD